MGEPVSWRQVRGWNELLPVLSARASSIIPLYFTVIVTKPQQATALLTVASKRLRRNSTPSSSLPAL